MLGSEIVCFALVIKIHSTRYRYLEHGLVATRVHCFIQYNKKAVFAPLCSEVSHHRRKADQDPRYKAYGETFKLMGNSYYGKCCTNIDKHMNVKFLSTENAAVAVCDPLFRKLEQIGSGNIIYLDCFNHDFMRQIMGDWFAPCNVL